LSAVAEIERENILEQTMNGRREKARQGKWNGGPAPYGYSLKDDTLIIEEGEAEVVRTIFDKFVYTNMGYTGIAKYLNLQGIKKTPRKKTDIEEFSAHFIKILLDNPVYCGKIAYGRRAREKVKGTKADYKVVNKQDFCLVDGLHEGIVDEELWERAHEKRQETGVKSESKYGKERAHLLTGIIKCPKCGSGMYANRVCWTKKDGTYKEVMYYACSRNKQERGRSCDYSANLKKTDIEPLVIEFIKELVKDEHFAAEIKKKIGLQVDTAKIDTEIHNYETKLKEVELNKARLEREIDSLPIDVTYRERKIHDMTLRLDGLYDTIAEIEANIEDARTRRKSVEAEFITMENIYKILEHFNELYDIISDEEKKELIAALVKEIQIYPEGESEMPLKSMKFNFPVYKDGKEVREIFLNNSTNVETLCVLEKIRG
jgi:ribosomal protein L32